MDRSIVEILVQETNIVRTINIFIYIQSNNIQYFIGMLKRKYLH